MKTIRKRVLGFPAKIINSSIETEASRVVGQVRVVAICRHSVDWQRRGMEASWVWVALLREAIREVAARMDVGADGDHWSWDGSARKQVDAWRRGYNRCSGLVGGHLSGRS